MPITQLVVAASLVLSASIVCGAVYSADSLRGVFAPNQGTELLGSIGATVLVIAICSWPWLLAFRAAATPPARPGANIFAIAALAAAASFFTTISTAPSEGVGYYVALYAVAVWIAGPLFLKIRSSE